MSKPNNKVIHIINTKEKLVYCDKDGNEYFMRPNSRHTYITRRNNSGHRKKERFSPKVFIEMLLMELNKR